MTDHLINPGGGTATNNTVNSSFTVGGCYSWNGPVCGVCHQGYIGPHKCKVDVLKAKIAELQKIIDEMGDKPMECCPPVTTNWPQPTWGYDTSGCGCRPENGGSGIYGCIMGGPQITS